MCISPAIREARGRYFELWCNGNTPPFGGGTPGSNPGSSTGYNPYVVSLIERSSNQRKRKRVYPSTIRRRVNDSSKAEAEAHETGIRTQTGGAVAVSPPRGIVRSPPHLLKSTIIDICRTIFGKSKKRDTFPCV